MDGRNYDINKKTDRQHIYKNVKSFTDPLIATDYVANKIDFTFYRCTGNYL